MRPAAFLLPLFLLVAPVFADESRPRTITVTGTASSFVVPDRAELRIELHIENADLPTAKKLNDDAAVELIDFLHKTGVDEKDIQVTVARSQPRMASRMDGKPVGTVLSYIVSRQYSVKLNDIKALSVVYDHLLPDTRISLFGEVLTTSEIHKYADQARLDAVKVAKDKADLLAKSLGASVGAAREVTEDADDIAEARVLSSRRGSVFSGGSAEDTTPIGLVEVQASVTVVFDLVPNAKAP